MISLLQLYLLYLLYSSLHVVKTLLSMYIPDFATAVPNDYGQSSADDEDQLPSCTQTRPSVITVRQKRR